ncbi:hypothetical protein RRG08_055155 [Elysia crispata]|uniref:Uncharacterized protein n=1 Tax=Elysia crispata TaxID=231223 RepID=A0AAE0Y2X3_9GAST|nr:hypothetical protein RRG08_055155 [Elysia crispata]
MSTYFLIPVLFILGISLIGIHGDEFDDILSSSMGSTLDDLDPLKRLTGASGPYRRNYRTLPYRRHNRGLNFMGGRNHIHGLPDLINMVLGLGGHIVGTAGSFVHDAVSSVFGSLFPQFKLRLVAAMTCSMMVISVVLAMTSSGGSTLIFEIITIFSPVFQFEPIVRGSFEIDLCLTFKNKVISLVLS